MIVSVNVGTDLEGRNEESDLLIEPDGLKSSSSCGVGNIASVSHPNPLKSATAGKTMVKSEKSRTGNGKPKSSKAAGARSLAVGKSDC